MNTLSTHKLIDSSKAVYRSVEEEILKAVREIMFGTVEVVVHDHRVMEIRQTRRKRFENTNPKSSV